METVDATTGDPLYRKLVVSNGNNDYPKAFPVSEGHLHHLYEGNYTGNLTQNGGVTFIDHGSPIYEFNEVWLTGNAHVAFFSDMLTEEAVITVDTLWGDRSAVLHQGQRQKFIFGDFNVYMPVNLLMYR